MSAVIEKERKLAKNTFWFAFGTLSSKVIAFLIVPFYTSILSQEEYGIADLITTTVSLLFPFFSLIITEAVFRFVLDKKGNDVFIFNFGLRIIFWGSIIVSFLSFFIFRLIPLVRDYWHLFILYYVISSICTLETEYIKGKEQVVVLSVVNIIQTLLFVGLNIVFLLFFKLKVSGYLLSFIISNFVSCIILFFGGKLKDIITFKHLESTSLRREMLSYSTPMIANSAMWWVTNFSDRYMVSFIISASANGLLSIAYKIPSMLSVAIGVFMSAWQLSVVDDFDNEKGKRFFIRVYKLYNEALLFISTILICSSKLLGRYLYSAGFFPAWRLSTLLIIGSLFHSLSGFLGTVFTTVKNTKMLFYSTASGAVINLILNYILIKYIGTVGAVIATVSSYFLTYLIRRISINKYLCVNVGSLKFLISYIMLVICSVLMYSDNNTLMTSAIIVGLLILIMNYGFVFYFFSGVRNSVASIMMSGKKE